LYRINKTRLVPSLCIGDTHVTVLEFKKKHEKKVKRKVNPLR